MRISPYICIMVFAGCATMSSLQPGAGGSILEVSGRAYEDVWHAAVVAISSNLAIVEIDKAGGYIKAEAPVGWTTWGEVVGVFIQPTDPTASSYRVEIHNLKRARHQITGQNWELTISARMKAELGI